MRKWFLCFLIVLTAFVGKAQVADSDTQLTRRLHHYMQLSKDLKFEQLMDYMHPALFTIAPKEDILKTFEAIYHNEEMKITIDSIAILAIGPGYKNKERIYKKVDYFMSLQLRYNDTVALADTVFKNNLRNGLEVGFPGKKISYNENNYSYTIAGNEVMFAIKENATAAWMFVGYNKNPVLIKALFPEAVIQHFKLL